MKTKTFQINDIVSFQPKLKLVGSPAEFSNTLTAKVVNVTQTDTKNFYEIVLASDTTGKKFLDFILKVDYLQLQKHN